MSKPWAPVCALVLAGNLLAGDLRAADDAAPLAWLAGHWCAAAGDAQIEEFWLPPSGNSLLGVGRTATGTDTRAFEYLRIVEQDGILHYLAQPGGAPPTAFRLAAQGPQWVRFENPDHDFPQRIEYRRDGDRLRAEIAGPGGGLAEQVISFDYRRCDD